MIALPAVVCGAMSPKPTVAIVTMAQYMLVGMLVKPCSGPSTTYISAPKMTTSVSTAQTKTKILRRLRQSAPTSCPLSSTYWVSFRMRNSRRMRRMRTTSRLCAPGTSTDM